MRIRLPVPVKGLFFSAGALAACFVASFLFAGWVLVRPGKRRDYDCIPRIRHGSLEAVELETSDGLRLHAWILRSRIAPPQHWALLLHGYRSDRTNLQNRARFFSGLGYNIMMLHFRGHGSSDRSRISYGYYERLDVMAAIRSIRSMNPGLRTRIGIAAVSMGAAAAAYAVGQGEIEPDWMILESCYDNIRHALANRLSLRVGRSLTPWIAWPMEFIVEHLVQLRAENLDPARALEKARCPVLVLAGDSERVLKMVEIEYLYGALPEPKRLVIFPGAGHEDLLAFDPRRYAGAVRSFLRDFAPQGVESLSRREKARAGGSIAETEATLD